MKNPALDNEYEKEKQKVKDFYYGIKCVACPNLSDSVVVFNNNGFRHLIRKGKRPRSKQDQLRRFRLVRYAPSVLASKNAIIKEDVEKTNDGATKAIFWKVSKRIGERLVTTVIRKIGAGNQHFFSIYDQKIARTASDSLECLPPA